MARAPSGRGCSRAGWDRRGREGGGIFYRSSLFLSLSFTLFSPCLDLIKNEIGNAVVVFSIRISGYYEWKSMGIYSRKTEQLACVVLF